MSSRLILNNVQHVFPGGAKICIGDASAPCDPLDTGLSSTHLELRTRFNL